MPLRTPDRDGRPGRPPRRSRLGLVLFVVLGLLLSVEVAVRIDDAVDGRDADFYMPPTELRSTMYIPHPYLGVVHRPGWKREQGYKVSINSQGLRGPEFSPRKPEGVFRIVWVGGSTTFGTGATEDHLSYPAPLERLLNMQADQGLVVDDRRFEVLNAGVSGYNSIDSLINFELRLLEFEPDAVIVYHAANDGRIVQARDFKADYSHMRRPPPIVRISALDGFLLRWVRLYARLSRGTDPEEQLRAMADWVFVPGYKDMTVRSNIWLNEEGLTAFMSNLVDIAAVARAHGVQPVFSTFAVANPDETAPEAGLARFVVRANEEITELSRRMHVPLVDVAGPLTGKPELYNDWIHFTEAGELLHAQVVLQAARQQKLFGLTGGR